MQIRSFEVAKRYPYEAWTRPLNKLDRHDAIDWCLDNSLKPVMYNHKPMLWAQIRDRWTKILISMACESMHPRKELFMFQSKDDRTLFMIRWS